MPSSDAGAIIHCSMAPGGAALATQSAQVRAKGEALIKRADRLLCESWNERRWSDGEPIDPSPTIDQRS